MGYNSLKLFTWAQPDVLAVTCTHDYLGQDEHEGTLYFSSGGGAVGTLPPKLGLYMI